MPMGALVMLLLPKTQPTCTPIVTNHAARR